MSYEDKKNGKKTFHSFSKNGKERKECSILFKRTEKNAKNGTFLKERIPNPVKKSSELRRISRKICVKIVALELLNIGI